MSKATTPRTLDYYKDPSGQTPYKSWFDALKDKTRQLKIEARLARVRAGNFGDYKGVGEGVKELKFNDGTRVYVGEDGPSIVILLCGGDKSSQKKDIKLAKDYWSDFKTRKKK